MDRSITYTDRSGRPQIVCPQCCDDGKDSEAHFIERQDTIVGKKHKFKDRYVCSPYLHHFECDGFIENDMPFYSTNVLVKM